MVMLGGHGVRLGGGEMITRTSSEERRRRGKERGQGNDNIRRCYRSLVSREDHHRLLAFLGRGGLVVLNRGQLAIEVGRRGGAGGDRLRQSAIDGGAVLIADR
jgi:hypothetical protein